jgi:hypothetical protein
VAGYVAVASIANTPNPGWKKSGRPNGVKKLSYLPNSRFIPLFFTFLDLQTADIFLSPNNLTGKQREKIEFKPCLLR